ncbi:glycosyl hydrolase family 61-domain-containing protein [Halenospora varia]|nr:glycosyl hydrolase family 61-domain-containing protein [Halenospora varia]
MKLSPLVCFALSLGVSAHYGFNRLIYPSLNDTPWQRVRHWTSRGEWQNQQTPLLPSQFNTTDIRCNANPEFANKTLTVKAGTTLGFAVDSLIFHDGPAMVYMAKVPREMEAESWDGSGKVFKIFEDFPFWSPYDWEQSRVGVIWLSKGRTEISFLIPATVSNGEYLVRIKHINLDYANVNPSLCAGKNRGRREGETWAVGRVSGAYELSDPILSANIHYLNETDYVKEPYMTRTPGPPVWKG